MTWHDRFDRLLKAMSEGEPHKAEKRAERESNRSKKSPNETSEG